MKAQTLPPAIEMKAAYLAKDAAYEGVFYTAVRTTRVFCRPTCPARKPAPQNVEFFASARDALFAGYRPCKRCCPLEVAGSPPNWLRPLLERMEMEPSRRWTDADLAELGLGPDRVRRWFQKHHRMTFHAYGRARRLGGALGRIREGESVIEAAFDQGYESLSGFNEAFRQLFGICPTRAQGSDIVAFKYVPTPLGPMIAGASEEGLYLLEFADRKMLQTQVRRLKSRLGCSLVPGNNRVLESLAPELDAYFARRRRTFSVPLRTPGSEFQMAVWDRLRQIPFGTRVTYSALARELGRPAAVRAVARAVGDNRIAILIPCHRVVASDGRLTGYGGGLWRKRRLLEQEVDTAFESKEEPPFSG